MNPLTRNSNLSRITNLNGATRDNNYDDAGQLTAITYKNPDASVLGDLGCTYDAGGRRTAVTGSLARTALPDALANAGVDAANRLTVSGLHSLTYDANGNLAGDGNQTYICCCRFSSQFALPSLIYKDFFSSSSPF